MRLRLNWKFPAKMVLKPAFTQDWNSYAGGFPWNKNISNELFQMRKRLSNECNIHIQSSLRKLT